MVYQNNYVLAILHKGKVLREVNGEVFLPFGSEYVIRLKNKSNLRCGVQVKVDGSLIHPPDVKLIVPSRGTLDLERMMVDGNMEYGPRLKFVEVDHPEVSDPDNPCNGLIEVSFFSEEICFRSSWCNNSWLWNSGTDFYGMRYDHSLPYTTCSTTAEYTACCTSSHGEPGATVPGSVSDQHFTHCDVTLESTPSAILHLRLKGIQSSKPVYVSDTRYKYCSQCGKRCRYKDNFCSRCGNKL